MPTLLTDQDKLDILRKRFPTISGFGADCLAISQNAAVQLADVMLDCEDAQSEIELIIDEWRKDDPDATALPPGPWIQIIMLLNNWIIQVLTGCAPPPVPAPTPEARIQTWATNPRPLQRIWIRSNVRRQWRVAGGFTRDRVGMAVDRRLLALRGQQGLKTIKAAIVEQKQLRSLLADWSK
jgi:hypothetical protein